MLLRFKSWWAHKWVRRGAWALLFLFVYIGIRTYQQRDLVVGLAPALAGVAIDGRALSLTNAPRATLVYFWATWCPICRLEHGTIESIAGDHPVITVAMQSGTDAELLRYMKEKDLKAPTLNDPGELAGNWGVRATPTFFIVDRQNQVRFREVGLTSEWGLRLRLWYANLS